MKPTRLAARTAVALACLFVATGPAAGQEHAGPEEGAQQAHPAPGAPEAQEAHGEVHERNALLAVGGATYESEEKDTFFTVGAEYERIISPRFGISVAAEYITEVDASVSIGFDF